MNEDRKPRLKWAGSQRNANLWRAQAGLLDIVVSGIEGHFRFYCTGMDSPLNAKSGTLDLAKIEAEEWLAGRCSTYIKAARDLGLLEKQPSAEEVLATIGETVEQVAELAALRKKFMDAWPKPKEDR